MTNKKSDGLIEHRGIEIVPEGERITGFRDLFMIWAGFSIVLTNLMLGSLGVDIGIGPAIVAQAIGIFFSALIVYIGTIIGSKYGIAGTVCLRSTFGIKGRIIPSIAIWVCGFGWFGVQTGIVAEGFDQLITTVIPGIPSMPKLWMVVWGLIMGIVAIFGYKSIVFLNRLAVPAMGVLIIMVLYSIFGVYYDQLASFTPTYSISFTGVINLLPSGMAAALILGMDYGRYTKGPKEAKAAPISLFIFTLLMASVGILAAATAGTWDPVQILSNLGLGVFGVLLMILAAWTTNVSNIYVAGLGISNITGMDRIQGSILSTLLGIGLALAGIFSYGGIMNFLSFITASLIPGTGIFLIDYYFKKRQYIDVNQLMKEKDSSYWYSEGWNIKALIAWIIGAVAAVKLPQAWMPAITSMAIGAIVYYILIASDISTAAKTSAKTSN